MFYTKWNKYLNHLIELQPLELTGRGIRYREPFYKDFKEVINDVFHQIKHFINYSPYAIYGHSMGSLIAYNLCRRIEEANLEPPKHLFLSGRRAPDYKDPEDQTMSELADSEFLNEIFKKGGTSVEFIDNKEFIDIFLPIIRADYQIINSYHHCSIQQKVNCDLTVFYGNKDDVTWSEMSEWRRFTNKDCKLLEYDGGHFFINDHGESIVEVMNKTLIEVFK